MTNPLVTAIPDSGTGSFATVRGEIAKTLALPLADAAAVAEFHSFDLATDLTLYPAVIYNGTVFEYDENDVLTGHDPDMGCITDASGRRYKISSAIKPSHIVLDKDLTSPPASPNQGDGYVVATAATGAWAGHDDEIAYYGRQGWQFRTINEGEIIYVADESRYYHMPASGTFTAGLGSLGVGDGSVTAKQLRDPFGFRVNAQQNDPPGSIPVVGTAYIVGETATGDWQGEENRIAESNGVSWEFYSPVEGNQVYDIASALFKVFRNGEWSATSSSLVEAIPVNIDHIYTMNSADDTDQVVKGFGFTLQPNDVVFFEVLNFELGLKKTSGSGNSYSAGTIFLRLDNSTINLVEVVPGASITSSSFNVSGEPSNFKLMDIVQDSAEHFYNIGYKINYNASAIVDEARLQMTGMIYIYRNNLVES